MSRICSRPEPALVAAGSSTADQVPNKAKQTAVKLRTYYATKMLLSYARAGI